MVCSEMVLRDGTTSCTRPGRGGGGRNKKTQPMLCAISSRVPHDCRKVRRVARRLRHLPIQLLLQKRCQSCLLRPAAAADGVGLFALAPRRPAAATPPVVVPRQRAPTAAGAAPTAAGATPTAAGAAAGTEPQRRGTPRCTSRGPAAAPLQTYCKSQVMQAVYVVVHAQGSAGELAGRQTHCRSHAAHGSPQLLGNSAQLPPPVPAHPCCSATLLARRLKSNAQNARNRAVFERYLNPPAGRA